MLQADASIDVTARGGYVVELAEVEAAWWVPQRRTRVIALATKGAASSKLVERTKAMAGKPSVTMKDAACGAGCYYAYRRQQRDRCCMPHDTPHPCLRKNSGYRPRAGTYKRRAPWQHRGRARPGDACAYAQAHKLSIDDYMVVQGWDPKYRGVLPAGDSKTARYRAVGLLANSVVPAVAEHAARSIVWTAGAAEPDERGAVERQAEGQAEPPSTARHSRSGNDSGRPHVGPGEHATSDEVRLAAEKAMKTLGHVGEAAHESKAFLF